MGLYPPFLVFLVLIFTSTYPYLANSNPQNNFTDLEALLSFKDHVVNPYGILSSNWTLNTSFCNWIGVTCSRRYQRIVALDLHSFRLGGTISPHLGNLSFLSSLVLGNNSLSGTIPDTLGHLPQLKILNLEMNSLFGTIPSRLFNMSTLNTIYLTQNNLSGALPFNHSLFMLPRLQQISLRTNQLIGQIPSSFARCLDIRSIDLSFNNFSGTIPSELGQLPKLGLLNLDDNHLTGKIPASLGNLTMLHDLYLAQNNLEGEIPDELGNLPNIKVLLFCVNKLNGSIPMALLNASTTTHLEIAFNYLTGHVPATLGESMPHLYSLLTEENQLTGGLDFITSLSNCRNLVYFDMSQNELDGVLPNSIGNLSVSFQSFSISGNRIKGNIPTGFGNLSNLIELSLASNELIGSIPSALARVRGLQNLQLSDNKINGPIPSELGLLTRLSYLFLNKNQLSGTIPDSLGNTTGLQHLSLASNMLSSNIPHGLWSLRGLIELNLSMNFLSCSIPPDVSNLKTLDKLDLSHNRLSNNISSTFGELQMLTYLDLSNNSFHGSIPQSLGGLIDIKYLNLSKNFLSGSIPKSLANLLFLESLDLSFNQLKDQIPIGRVFINRSIPSLQGNAELCGAAWLGFPPCSTNDASSHSGRNLQSLKYILPSIVFILVVFSWLCFLFSFHRKRREKIVVHNGSTHLRDHRLISYNDLVRATNNFSHDNLMGRGCFGSVFKGCLEDRLVIAVKVLNLEVDGASTSFDVECQVLRTIRHRNLIKIISTCSNLNFKALILQFMPNGSLDQWLHSDNYYLSLVQRLNIMVDVSLALEYLHHHHPHVVLHCDLKPSNILLDQEMVARVSDFGIAKLLFNDNISVVSASTPGTIGYIAPEYGSTGKVSTMGDIYSFGILLLETFTRKRPTDVMDGESSLREWICKAYPTTILDIVDNDLLKENNCPEQETRNPAAMHRCLLSLFELGLVCSRHSPKERMLMIDVVRRLQNIKVEYLSQLSNM